MTETEMGVLGLGDWVLVPREATEAMLKAAACQGVGSYSAHHAYRAMIAAAPAADGGRS